jgi:hypothetical protein
MSYDDKQKSNIPLIKGEIGEDLKSIIVDDDKPFRRYVKKIIIENDVDTIIENCKKDMLYIVITDLELTINTVNSISDILTQFIDIKTLENVIIHTDKKYSMDERNEIKQFFLKTEWITIQIENQFKYRKSIHL